MVKLCIFSLYVWCNFWNSCIAANRCMFRPLGSSTSGVLPSRCVHSSAVTSDTVVKTCAPCAAAFSSWCCPRTL